MSLIKHLNNVNESAHMNTKQQQNSKWLRLQLSRAEFNGFNTNRELKSEPAEFETKRKYMRLFLDFILSAARLVKTGFNVR